MTTGDQMLDIKARQNEVDANFEAFQKMLPDLIGKYDNRWALMRNRECVAFYDTVRDAVTAGDSQFKDGLFSVQEVTERIVDLGWFSHAMP